MKKPAANNVLTIWFNLFYFLFRYNLLDSAILELFEFIKLEDIKSLCSHVVENFGKILDDVEYVQTFKSLKDKYDQHQDKPKDRERGMYSPHFITFLIKSLLYRVLL